MKIVITGPESSGKTTLLNEINNKWNFTIIPEYARIYIDKLNRPYNYDDILEIAKGQIALEDNLNEVRSTLLFASKHLLKEQPHGDTFVNKQDQWSHFYCKKKVVNQGQSRMLILLFSLRKP